MAFLLRRVVFYLAAFIAAATINFFLPRLMPGDPIQIMFSGAGSNLSMENLNALKLTFGFIDAPIGQQYLAYLQSVFTGDLGRSIKYFPLPVTELLARALVWTVGLVGSATIVSFVLGTLLGVMAAWRRGTVFDAVVSLLAIFSSGGHLADHAVRLRLPAGLVPQWLCG
jgi:peptide/nickel transport system permease protein